MIFFREKPHNITENSKINNVKVFQRISVVINLHYVHFIRWTLYVNKYDEILHVLLNLLYGTNSGNRTSKNCINFEYITYIFSFTYTIHLKLIKNRLFL